MSPPPPARPDASPPRPAGSETAAPGRWREPRHEAQVLWLSLLTGLPGFALGMGLLWTGDLPRAYRWLLTLAAAALWLAFAAALRRRVVHPLQTLANQLGALRGGDFALRARGARADDALGLAMLEANALSATLREQRIGAMEATALLRKVIEEIDVAVFAFDEAVRLRLVNRAGERLLGRPRERLLGLGATEVGLAFALEGEALRTLDHAFPGGSGRWQIRRDPFRQGGRRHRLLVISDLSRALREEERQAWQRLIRVLSHEINNSLAPIQSIAGTLHALASRQPPPDDLGEDLLRGLDVIGVRARSLGAFMAEYARLARLPPPTPRPMEVGDWVRHAAGLETRVDVAVVPAAPVEIRADRDQLDQLMINLLRNAADAALETGGGVRVGWAPHADSVEIWVEDDGPGLPQTANLFVPFFTTKPNGSGIGLVLSRQIAENQGGTLTLRDRPDAHGCIATLVLPLSAS